METIQTNNLSFYNDQGILTLNAKQYDTGRKFVFYILDNDAPFDLTGCSVYLRVLKADGTQFQGEECCIIDNNTVTIDTSVSNGNQILTAEGQNQCELHLTDKDGKMLTTWEFIIHVQKRVHNGDNIVSTDSWDLMDYIENTAKDFNEKLENHYFVLTMDKDTAGGVPSLDADGKLPLDELYEATITSKGITQLTDSITSTSTATAATPNSVKTAYEKLDISKAPLASPTLTGTPKAPTAPVGTNTTQIATTAFVQTAVSNGIAASDAMIIKGTIGATGTVTELPSTYKTGWTYRVVSAGTYAGQVCEIGDLIIALVDRDDSDNADSDWCVAQTNINGAITGVKSGDAFIQTSQSGSVVTITHKDVTRTNTTSTAAPSHGGTFTAVKSVTSDSKGHVTGVDTETVTLPENYTHPTTSGSKHIPSGGSSGQILKWSADGTAVWGDASALSINGGTLNGSLYMKNGKIYSNNGTGKILVDDDHVTLCTENSLLDEYGLMIKGLTIKPYYASQSYDGNAMIDLGSPEYPWKNIYANNFIGNATKDGNGNVISDTYLPLAGGTITGNLRLKGSGNYGNKLNFGDGNYAYIYEPEDDVLEIKGQSGIRFISDEEILFNGKTLETTIKEYSGGSGSDIYATTINNNTLSASNPCNYICTQFNNGLMILSLSFYVTTSLSSTILQKINLPVSFINDHYAAVCTKSNSNILVYDYDRQIYQNKGMYIYNKSTNSLSVICGDTSLYNEQSQISTVLCIGRWK